MVSAAKFVGARRRQRSKYSGKKRRRLSLVGLIMGALLLAVGAALVAGCGDEQQASVTVDTGGRLQLTETTYDFGAVPVGQQVQHDFVLTNTGTGPLNLGQMSVKRLEGC